MVKKKGVPKKNLSDTNQKVNFLMRRKTTNMLLGSKSFKILRTTMKEIKRLQSTVMHCIPKLPFSRLIREILMEQGSEAHRIQIEALRGLQEAAEIYLTYLFEDANKCAMHARRVTLMPKDIKLVLEIRGVQDPGYG